jgi:succinate-semialdehyde dehydrogenase/glutarate-semialdehyde dehydrogenase
MNTNTAQAFVHTKLLIDGEWCDSSDGRRIPVIDPATEEIFGSVARATLKDLDAALSSAVIGSLAWSAIPPPERSKIIRKAAELLRERAVTIAPLLTREQGKPLAEAQGEISSSADFIEWLAEEARRTYGRVIPARLLGVRQILLKEPVGPVATFTPWNFPINAIVRKLAAALAAGCPVIVKGPEETPASAAELIRAFLDAGVPHGVINLVYGDPAEISRYLISHPVIRKISFTGSTVVGKQLASLAGLHMKRVTMELGGHAPVIVSEDADLPNAVRTLAFAKFRNAGQICISPTRFLVHEKVYDRFLNGFVAAAQAIKVGNGFEKETQMGPLANERRIPALEAFVADAVERGAELQTGGHRIGNKGFFFEPTVLSHVPIEARVMNEEPFGPLAIVNPFSDLDEAISEANRLPYGLASYAHTTSLATTQILANRIEAGMLTVNHNGLSFPEVAFGGVKDSGYGSEGGPEAIEAYLTNRFVSVA